jgi:hypothetical protein
MANATSDYTNFFPAQRKTRLPGGYMGKILRVDMTTGKLTDLNLPEEPMLRKYWGGHFSRNTCCSTKCRCRSIPTTRRT